MIDKKKGLASVAALHQAGETTCDRADLHSNDTTERATGQEKEGFAWEIADLLLYGQENALTLRHLEVITGLSSRSVRKRIAAEGLEGTPILSDNVRGYFLPSCEEEKERFIRSMKHRAREIERAAEAIKKAKG